MDRHQTSKLPLHANPKASGWNMAWIKQVISCLKTVSSLKAVPLETPLGTLLALSDERYLYGLYFSDRPTYKTIENLSLALNTKIHSKITFPIESVQHELQRYFKGDLKRFETPIQFCGSAFQKRAWEALREVPYGVRLTYTEQATLMGMPKSYRAVANANRVNSISIVVPCHRIIRSNGELSGYAGGVSRKHWLIAHEQKNWI